MAFSGLGRYTELGSMFPNRSGADVVYLEQAYPKPRFLFPTTFALITVLLSFSATNAIGAHLAPTPTCLPLTDHPSFRAIHLVRRWTRSN